MLVQVANVFNNVISENVNGIIHKIPFTQGFFFYLDVDNTAVLKQQPVDVMCWYRKFALVYSFSERRYFLFCVIKCLWSA